MKPLARLERQGAERYGPFTGGAMDQRLRPPLQQPLNVPEQFTGAKRFGQVVVSTELQAAQFLPPSVMGCEPKELDEDRGCSRNAASQARRIRVSMTQHRRCWQLGQRSSPMGPLDTFPMTTTTAPQPNVKLNFNDRDYEFSELPRPAQLLLQDMMQLEQQITKLQFELRHLQAAKHTYGTSLRKAMSEEENAEFSAGHSGDGPNGHGDHHD